METQLKVGQRIDIFKLLCADTDVYGNEITTINTYRAGFVKKGGVIVQKNKFNQTMVFHKEAVKIGTMIIKSLK
jgi:hypothetical protein